MSGTKNPHAPVGFSILLAGYDRAFERLAEARSAAKVAGDVEMLYIPLMETLNWADAIEERLTEDFGKNWVLLLPTKLHALAEVIIGFRHTRNSVHHQWSNAVYMSDGPRLLRDWHWNETAPVGRRNPKNEAAYASKIAGRALRHTFRDLHKLYIAAEKVLLLPAVKTIPPA